jgi:battenin
MHFALVANRSLKILPLVIPITYFFLLPPSSALLHIQDAAPASSAAATLPYTPLAADDDEGEEGVLPSGPKPSVSLSPSDKWRLVKPMLVKYMLPLCEQTSRTLVHSSLPCS